MVISQHRPKRKVSGGVYHNLRKKRKCDMGRAPSLTKISDKSKVKKIRTLGRNSKLRILTTDTANVLDPKTKKYSKTKIKTVVENPANRQYARRNIITKGTIIDTEKGKAKITSRPGQDGIVNAVLI